MRRLLVTACLYLPGALAAGCGPRATFDPYDKLALGPIKVDPRVEAEDQAVLEELRPAIRHYLVQGGVFRDVQLTTATADATTARVEIDVEQYQRDTSRPLGVAVSTFLGGRATGYAKIRYRFRDPEGRVIWEERMKTIARANPGLYVNLPPPLGGVDATAEGAGTHLLYWMRRQKSNPRQALAPASPGATTPTARPAAPG